MSPELHRSYLYAPGDAPEVMAKALASAADAVVLDLEDAVHPDRIADARGAIARAIVDGAGRPGIHVRIGQDATGGYRREDVAAVTVPGLEALRLPKAEDPNAIKAVGGQLADLERDRGIPLGTVRLYPTIESAAGLVALAALAGASPRVVRFAFGASDYLADIAADEPAVDHARSAIVVASRAAGVGPPIDRVHTELDDVDGLHDDAVRARRLGLYGKSVIHPRQLDVVHAAFRPSDDEVAAARRVMDAWREAQRQGRSAGRVGGTFVDPAVVARAAGVLRHVEEDHS